MSLPRLASLDDLRRIETRPYEESVPWRGPLDVLRAAAGKWPSRDALVFVRRGDPDDAAEPPVRESFEALLANVLRAANAFRAAGLRDEESVALLLPPVPAAHHALWGAEVADRDAGDALADRFHDTSAFMAENGRENAFRIGTGQGVGVGMTHAGGHDTYQHFAFLRRHQIHFFN